MLAVLMKYCHQQRHEIVEVMVSLEGEVEEELVEAEGEVEEGGEVETKHRLRAHCAWKS